MSCMIIIQADSQVNTIAEISSHQLQSNKLSSDLSTPFSNLLFSLMIHYVENGN